MPGHARREGEFNQEAAMKFPKHIFVKEEQDTDGSVYLVAHQTASDIAERAAHQVAVYQFVKLVHVQLVVKETE